MARRSAISRRDFLKGVASAAGLAVLGSACVPPAPGAAPAAPAAEKAAPAEVNLRVWWWVGPEQQGVVSAFEKANPGIKVSLEELGEAVYGNPKYLTAVAAGTGPDVAYQNRHTFRQFAARKLYFAIDELFARDGYKKEDFPKAQMEEVTWDGVLYGIPYVVDTRYFYWNRKHFEEVGLDPNVPPATWDELAAFTSKLNIKKGDEFERFGFIPGFPPGLADQLLIFAIENGAKSYTSDFRTCLLDQPEWVEALDWVVKFYDEYCGGFGISAGFLQGFVGQAQDAFVQDRISMSSYGSWMISGYAAFPDLDYDGTALMPVSAKLKGEKINWACDWSFVLDPNSKVHEEGWTYVKFATGPDGFMAAGVQGLELQKQSWARQQLPGEPVYAPPPPAYRLAREKMQAEFYSKLPDRQRKMKESELDAVTWAQGCGNLGGMTAAEIWTGFRQAWDVAVAKQATPQDALTQAKNEVQKALDAVWTELDKQA